MCTEARDFLSKIEADFTTVRACACVCVCVCGVCVFAYFVCVNVGRCVCAKDDPPPYYR